MSCTSERLLAENKQLKDYIATTELEIVADANAHRDEIKQLKEEMGHLCNEEDAKEHWGLVDGNELDRAKEEIKTLKEVLKETLILIGGPE